jgi:hypothetical protein
MVAPLLLPFLSSLLAWLFRDVVVKFLVFTAVIALVGFLVPLVVGFLGSFISPGFLTSGFQSALSDPGICFFLSFFQLGYGLQLLISAYVARFLIRRLPVIG